MSNYLLPTDDDLPMRSSGRWAAEKLDYLRRYIEVFETSMRVHWKIRNYVDLLAGPGKNRIRETGDVLLGSPLLALTTTHPFTGYYCVERDHRNVGALATRCQASPLFERVTILSGDCNIQVEAIVASLEPQASRSLNLAFLDPAGMELKWNTVRRLASIPRMDLIINYPQGGLNRLMKRVYTSDRISPVDEFFGDSGWRTIYAKQQGKHGASIHGGLIEFYMHRLYELGYKEVKRDDQVGDEPLMRNVRRNAPLYRLLFASKNPLGDKFWHSITRRNVHGQARLF
jgi:three-Cys-motif partner protein